LCGDVPLSQGSITREPGEERIAYLARVRNAVLQPVFDVSTRRTVLARHLGSSPRDLLAWETAFTSPDDRVIFLNDAFFSWQVRLLLTGESSHGRRAMVALFLALGTLL
jgi:hypothetical protein